MQLLGLALLGFIVWFGFRDRSSDQAISAFDAHALVMVLVGSGAAVLVSSRGRDALSTLTSLRELVPGLRGYGAASAAMEAERSEASASWEGARRREALAVAERTRFAPVKRMIELLISRASEVEAAKTFMELRHAEIARLQPAINNWEMLSKLGPAFGMVGTITGMIRLFQNMSAENLNIGAAMSLALLATLYGVAFGAGVAGPIAQHLNRLLDERLGVLERCEKGAVDSGARTAGSALEARVG